MILKVGLSSVSFGAQILLGAAFAIAVSSCASPLKTPGVAESGSVKPEYLREVVKTRAPRYSACYEAAIDKRPGAMGKARVTWDIDGDGDVKNARLVEVDPSLSDIEACLIHEVSELHFDRSKMFREDAVASEIVEVSYPFYFDERQSFTPEKLNPAFRRPAPGAAKEGAAPPIAPPIKNPTEK